MITDVRSYSRGDIDGGKLGFNLTGTGVGVGVGVGYLGGPVAGALTGLTFDSVEKAYDKVSAELKVGYNNFIDNLVYGWQSYK